MLYVRLMHANQTVSVLGAVCDLVLIICTWSQPRWLQELPDVMYQDFTFTPRVSVVVFFLPLSFSSSGGGWFQ